MHHCKVCSQADLDYEVHAKRSISINVTVKDDRETVVMITKVFMPELLFGLR